MASCQKISGKEDKNLFIWNIRRFIIPSFSTKLNNIKISCILQGKEIKQLKITENCNA